AGLRCRENREVVQALVLDERLLQLRLALNHVDEVEDHAPLATHDHVQVAQADIEIDHHGSLAAHREAGADGGRGGGLPDSAFAGGDDDDLRQGAVSRLARFSPYLRTSTRNASAS